MKQGVRVIVAYDGSDFHGWQRQDGLPTVQGALEAAAARVAQHPIICRGAGRTDAGVHAEGQVAAFATSRELPPRRWVMSLNRYLPPQVSVRSADACAPGYDPRFDATDKTYRYIFHVAPVRKALMHNRVWHLGQYIRYRFPEFDRMDGGRHKLDVQAMQQAAARMVGTHDFRAFRQAADTRDVTERTMMRVEVIEDFGGNPDLIALEVRGTAFMKNMVRIMAGTLIDVGRGRFTADHVSSQLSSQGDRQKAGTTAPPEGLTLVEVNLGRLRDEASR